MEIKLERGIYWYTNSAEVLCLEAAGTIKPWVMGSTASDLQGVLLPTRAIRVHAAVRWRRCF